MINSRLVSELLEPVAQRASKFLVQCELAGIDILITSTYRDMESQERLYAQGRVLPGQIVTWARAGDSWHNWRRAFDVVPLRNGKPVWSIRGLDKELWVKVGEIGQACGLEWGGAWPRHPDYPHFQDRMGATLQGLKKEAGLIK
jgi:peptidoglycan L-alanyl-D-glutamate endopeptidase CwlK